MLGINLKKIEAWKRKGRVEKLVKTTTYTKDEAVRRAAIDALKYAESTWIYLFARKLADGSALQTQAMHEVILSQGFSAIPHLFECLDEKENEKKFDSSRKEKGSKLVQESLSAIDKIIETADPASLAEEAADRIIISVCSTLRGPEAKKLMRNRAISIFRRNIETSRKCLVFRFVDFTNRIQEISSFEMGDDVRAKILAASGGVFEGYRKEVMALLDEITGLAYGSDVEEWLRFAAQMSADMTQPDLEDPSLG